MSKVIELKLIELAQKIADRYKNNIEVKYYEQLCNTITICQKCNINNNGSWIDIYKAVMNDNGIWEYAEWDCYYFTEEIRNMWALVTDILICNCYLICIKQQNVVPEDIEIQSKNIPEFVKLLEKSITEKINYKYIFEFWNKKMCY